MKIFSRMLYIVLGQQWTSSTMAGGCQWSSRSRTILERIAAGSGPVIAENALRTSTNKEVWIASILGKLGNWGVEFSNSPYKRDRGVTQKWMPRNAELSAHANNPSILFRNFGVFLVLFSVQWFNFLPLLTLAFLPPPFDPVVGTTLEATSTGLCERACSGQWEIRSPRHQGVGFSRFPYYSRHYSTR